MSSPIDYAGEGPTDAILARRLILEVGGVPGRDYVTGSKALGKDALDRRLPGLILAARHGRPILVLRDLDRDVCAVNLVRSLVPVPVTNLCLRVAVRAAEAWLLADRDGLAEAMRVPLARLPADPDELLDPKTTLRELGCNARIRPVRAAFSGTPQQAQGWVAEFIAGGWQPARARQHSASLERALRHLAGLAGV